MTSGEITVSIALKTAADSMIGQMKENSLSCIGSNSYFRAVAFIIPDFSLKQEVLVFDRKELLMVVGYH